MTVGVEYYRRVVAAVEDIDVVAGINVYCCSFPVGPALRTLAPGVSGTPL